MPHRIGTCRAVLAVAAVIGISLSGTGKDAPSTSRCVAEVTNTDHNVAECPVASLHFHGRVSGCRHSTGNFVYRYLWVDQERKDEVVRTASWTAHDSEWDMTERVPATCGKEIDAVAVDPSTSCVCTER